METLIELSKNKIQEIKPLFKRYLLGQLPIDQRLVFIKGGRGSGKTTIMLQYVREKGFSLQNTLYISLDDIIVSTLRLTDIADNFYKRGGKLLLLDEVHKYPGWSKEIKNIYDRYSELHLVVTCSSALMMSKGEGDLSRRALFFHLNELSLREFIELKHGIKLPFFSLEEILSKHEQISDQIKSAIKPVMAFNEYVKYGAYPYFIEGEKYYNTRLNQAVNMVLENDLTAIENIAYGSVIKLRKLLSIIAETVPFKPNVKELSEKINTTRDQLMRLLYLLENAQIIYQLRNNSFGMSHLSKPEKIYLHNPNIAAAITHSKTNKGTERETFFINQLSQGHNVTYSKEGDFIIDNQITFEIGGKNKPKKQIQNTAQAYIVKDDIEYGTDNIIPLWLFGFLY